MVRVSEDAPRVYLRGWGKVVEYDVNAVDGDAAIITYGYQEIVIPLKYLVKVEEEKKEAKFKVGDRVRNIESGLIGVVDKIVYGNIAWVNGVDGKRYHWKSDELELVEPTEQTEAEKTKTKGDTLTFPIALDLNEALDGCDCFVSIREQIRKAQRDMEENNKPRYIPKIMFNTEFWDAYAADLAKEIALKVANKKMDNHPEEIGAYAVSVAKAVVEGLKRE